VTVSSAEPVEERPPAAPPAVPRALPSLAGRAVPAAALDRLLRAVQDLSRARDLPAVIEIVRHAARELTGADGATFVLRDGAQCHYADEDAIAPLWKGRRFPMADCISGWVMEHGQAVAIADVLADERVPSEAYRPTFVVSLAMVPIRSESPIGAIGNYWAAPHHASADEIAVLQALADSASIAIEHVETLCELERRVADRTASLEAANAALESFASSVSHDLRAPLRAIEGFAAILMEEHAPSLGEEPRRCLRVIDENSRRMRQLIDDLAEFSRLAGAEAHVADIDVEDVVHSAAEELRRAEPGRAIELRLGPLPRARGDGYLLRRAFRNLLSNAFKFTRGRAPAIIEVGASRAGTHVEYWVRDNGVGFDMRHAATVFGVFSRLDPSDGTGGSGVGLALVKRIAERHGGRCWAMAEPGGGATFTLSLPAAGAPA
jgi:signal transduction histidine kinase